MSKFCPKCGEEMEKDANFCSNCGNDSTKESKSKTNAAVSTMIQKRDIVLAIVLSIVTCGIYTLYWFVVMTDDANKISEDDSTSGGVSLLLTIITCGIYGFYWNYKMGKKIYDAGQNYNKNIPDNSILYLILSLFGFSIISYCLIQSDLNKFSE